MSKIMIRRMELGDLNEVAVLEKQLFTSPWSWENYRHELTDNEYAMLWVIEKDEQILGYCGLWILFDTAQITTIGIMPEARKQGLGSKLMDTMIEAAQKAQCENISLEVRVSNEAAQHLYQNYGFETINIRKGYYQDNFEDAYLMMKPLGEPLWKEN